LRASTALLTLIRLPVSGRSRQAHNAFTAPTAQSATNIERQPNRPASAPRRLVRRRGVAHDRARQNEAGAAAERLKQAGDYQLVDALREQRREAG
jgi:hypothetical protein